MYVMSCMKCQTFCSMQHGQKEPKKSELKKHATSFWVVFVKYLKKNHQKEKTVTAMLVMPKKFLANLLANHSTSFLRSRPFPVSRNSISRPVKSHMPLWSTHTQPLALFFLR